MDELTPEEKWRLEFTIIIKNLIDTYFSFNYLE